MSLKRKNDDVNINIWGLQKEMQPVLKHAHTIWTSILGIPDLVITSARDGFHSPGSFHYYGYAVDLRTWDANSNQVSAQLRNKLADELRHVLSAYSPFYDVIVHKTHIHVEFDFIKAGLIGT